MTHTSEVQTPIFRAVITIYFDFFQIITAREMAGVWSVFDDVAKSYRPLAVTTSEFV